MVHDQAARLRSKLNERRTSERSNPQSTNAEVLSIVSGKGGVGKSNIALNFSLGLVEKGYRVLLFDLDIGMANVDILLGQSATYSIVDMLEQQMPISTIIETGPKGLSYVAGGSGLNDLFRMDDARMAFFTEQLTQLDQDYDFILFDMGAGATEDSLKFILSSHEVILITTPEPTSITDAYAMVKYIHMHDHNLGLSLMINRSESEKEGKQTGRNLQNVCRQFLKKEVRLLGAIPQDETVLKAVKAQVPFTIHSPAAKSTKALRKTVSFFIGERIQQEEQRTFSSFVSKFKRVFQPHKEE
ncbi:MinD/ParA family protein [Texcoconibacillus texcoconensis]|uniref:Flagellar biosynthesis protein FlhG n=1 Tax=Texcoconibacillus texcoconensis TaxID=1095777 RepID=A0A840QJ37_9BACI|nr:MinD/ParA family protein [Texcoconibacillus texcoconensis]MBB5172058.1 flagellar biosynthesis protein FlhG [Texcoconibacillus texcoconensis]